MIPYQEMQHFNPKVFDKAGELQQLSAEMLTKLVGLAQNPKQLNAIVQANNLNNAVGSAILRQKQISLLELTPESLIRLSRVCEDKEDLMKILQVTGIKILMFQNKGII